MNQFATAGLLQGSRLADVDSERRGGPPTDKPGAAYTAGASSYLEWDKRSR